MQTLSRKTLLVPELFEDFRRRAREGELANHAGMRRLLSLAEEALSSGPFTVTDKKHLPPSGDKRDYFSLSIYFWPNPDTPDGLPYAPRDGQPNPEISDYDRPRFEEFCRNVDILALAYAATGDERFAAKASALLRVWFVDEKTRMNPNMLFAQFIPGDNVVLPWKEYPARFVPGTDGRQGVYVSFGGTIEDLNIIPLTDSIGLLEPSPHWSGKDRAAVGKWYADYAEWLLTHQHGLDEAACRNNHGSWYWAGIVCFLNFSGQRDRAGEFAAKALPERLKLQIDPDGSQPEELVRTISMSYTSFSLCSFTNFAISAKKCGFDAWHFETDDGRSIRRAMDWLTPYLLGEKEWAWKQISPFDPEILVGQLAACSAAYSEPAYLEIIGRLHGLPKDSLASLIYAAD
ncbi:MAG: alginate lyase family protein [Verrucomicrobiota bacterium]